MNVGTAKTSDSTVSVPSWASIGAPEATGAYVQAD